MVNLNFFRLKILFFKVYARERQNQKYQKLKKLKILIFNQIYLEKQVMEVVVDVKLF